MNIHISFSSQSLIPKDLPNCLMDDDLARILMQYFFGANQVIDKMAGGHSKLFSQKAFYDTLGGYLKYYMIPIARYSYYAGLLKLRTVENVLQLYAQCKFSLNTNGNGWKAPLTDFTDLDIQIEPLRIIVRNEEEDTSCIQLDLMDDRGGEDEDMIVALPRLDPEERGVLGNIWLPFKRKRTFNLQSCMSAFVLLRYFELTTRCYNFQGVCQDTFNKKLKGWILENIEIHLGDDVLYPGLGAILRIIETLRRKNKGTIVMAKTNEKRQKTKSYKVLENKAKQFENDSESWLDGVFGGKGKDVLDDYEDRPSNRDDSRRLAYIIIAIIVAVLLLLFVIALAVILKYCRKKKPTDEIPKENVKKKLNICDRFKSRKKKDDEEVLLSPDSSSIASSQKPKPEKTKSSKSKPTKPKKELSKNNSSSKRDSSSSSSPPQAPKCFGLCTAKQNNPDKSATSMDSDSGVENKGNEPKTPPPLEKPAPSPKVSKMGTVDEKKRFSISKKNKSKPEEPASAPGNGTGSAPGSASVQAPAPNPKRVGILKK